VSLDRCAFSPSDIPASFGGFLRPERMTTGEAEAISTGPVRSTAGFIADPRRYRAGDDRDRVANALHDD